MGDDVPERARAAVHDAIAALDELAVLLRARMSRGCGGGGHRRSGPSLRTQRLAPVDSSLA